MESALSPSIVKSQHHFAMVTFLRYFNCRFGCSSLLTTISKISAWTTRIRYGNPDPFLILLKFCVPFQRNLLTNLLQLAVNCLNFDFIGSMIDDTSDENVSVQVPTAWRVAFVDSSIVKLFYGLYAVLPPELSALVSLLILLLTLILTSRCAFYFRRCRAWFSWRRFGGRSSTVMSVKHFWPLSSLG